MNLTPKPTGAPLVPAAMAQEVDPVLLLDEGLAIPSEGVTARATDARAAARAEARFSL